MRTILVRNNPPKDEEHSKGLVKKYAGQRGKTKPQKGKMLTVITQGLRPRG